MSNNNQQQPPVCRHCFPRLSSQGHPNDTYPLPSDPLLGELQEQQRDRLLRELQEQQWDRSLEGCLNFLLCGCNLLCSVLYK